MISRIKLLVVGKLKRAELKSLVKEYQSKIQRYIPFEVIEIKDSNKEKEGDRILEIMQKHNGPKVAFTEDGKSMKSRVFASQIQEMEGVPLYIIGGPDGIDRRVLNCVNYSISLSPMTFTHEMAQYLVMEQIFRAFTIINNTGYHRD